MVFGKDGSLDRHVHGKFGYERHLTNWVYARTCKQKEANGKRNGTALASTQPALENTRTWIEPLSCPFSN